MGEIPRIELNDGTSMPVIGFGVYTVPADEASQIVGEALRVGYRSIDTAWGYFNEEGVGQAIHESGIPRDDIHVTTKVWNSYQGREKALESFEVSMGNLGLDRLDLLLIHWPAPANDLYVETWETFVELRESGRVTSIGVSNFQPEHLGRIIEATGVIPVLILLALAQVFVARRSRRRLNPGLMAASVLMAVLAVWLMVAGVLSARAVADARTRGGQPLDTAVTARILAQEARADEILGLLKRGSDPQSDSNFDQRTAQLAELIDGAGMTGAADALDGWVRAQGEIRGKLAVGDFAGAVGIARDDGPQHSTPQFTRLDTALGDEITRLRDTQRQSLLRASTAMNLLPLGATVIGVSAGLAVAAGFGPRLSEYH